MPTLFQELKRRGVIRVGLAYLAIAWLSLQVLDIISGVLQLPDWPLKVALIAMSVGLPIALVLAWLYDVTGDGIRGVAESDDTLETPGLGGRKIDFVIIGALSLVIVVLVVEYSIVPRVQDPDLVPPTVSNYRRVTESRVIFPPFLSPYPLVLGNSRLYFSSFETGRIGIKQVAMSGGEAEPVTEPESNPETLFRPTSALPDGSGMILQGFVPPGDDVLIWKYPFVGGSPQVLGEGADAVFSPDGKQIAYSDLEANLMVADADMQNARMVTATNSPRIHWIRWSHDGSRLSYTSMGRSRSIWEVDIEKGKPKPRLPEWAEADHCCGVWTPDGRYFVFQATRDLRTQLYAIREPASDSWGAPGEPVPVTVGPLDYRRPTVAPNGKSLFAIGWQLRGETVILDPATGQLRPLAVSEELPAEWVGFATNADRMTYVSYPAGHLWVSHTDGSSRLQLTFDDFKALAPQLSPDGQYVVFDGWQALEPLAVFLVSATGGKPERISPAGKFAYTGGFSPDGKKVVLRVEAKDVIQVYDVDSKIATELRDSAGLYNPHWSPGGKQLLAYGTDWLTLYDLDSGQTRKLIENRPLEDAYWGSDDSTIYVIDPPYFGADRAVYSIDTNTGAEQTIIALGNNRLAIGQWNMWVGVTPAGEPMFLRDLSIHHIYELDWLP